MSAARRPVERVALWGLMASGKSAVGAELARRLGWEFLDLDREIERREGRSIAEIFAADGEAAFRRMEVEATRAVVGRRRLVLSLGGGWVTSPEAPRLLPPGTLTVWLRVSPERALERVRSDPGGAVRPLLATPDPGATLRRLLEEREPLYRAAEMALSTDELPLDEVVLLIETRVRGATPAPGESLFPKGYANEG